MVLEIQVFYYNFPFDKMASCHLTEDQNYCKRWHDAENAIQGCTVAHNCNARTWEPETEG